MIESLSYLIALLFAPFIAMGCVVTAFAPFFIISWIKGKILWLFGLFRKKQNNHFLVKLLDENDPYRKYEEEYVRRKENGHQD